MDAHQDTRKYRKKLVNAYLWVKCLEDASFGWFGTTYVLFLLGCGITPEQATQINTIFMTVNFFIDLPTGALGDLFGQIPVYLIGLVIVSGGFFLYGFGTTFWFFVMCEAFSAIGTALMSEALEAMITSEIGTRMVKKVHAREGVITRLATIPTKILGSFAGAIFGLQLPWMLASISMLITFSVGVITLSKFHKKPEQNSKSKKHFWATVRTGVRLLLGQKQTRFVLLIVCALSATMQAPNMFWTIILKEQSNSAGWLGFMWIGMAGAMAYGSHAARKISFTKRNICLLLLSIGGPLWLCAIIPPIAWLTSVLFIVHEIGRGALPVILYAYLNDHIPSPLRTTTNSARGSIERMFQAIGLLSAGILSNHMSLISTWLVSGEVLIILAVLITIPRRKIVK